MANLRKRVAACDLERKRPLSDASRTSESNQDELDNRPLLSKVCTCTGTFVFLIAFAVRPTSRTNKLDLLSTTCGISMRKRIRKRRQTKKCLISELRPHNSFT